MTNDILFQLNQSGPAKATSASRSEFESWSQESRDAVEEGVLAETRMILDALSAPELQSAGALGTHIGRAIAETKRRVHLGGVRRGA